MGTSPNKQKKDKDKDKDKNDGIYVTCIIVNSHSRKESFNGPVNVHKAHQIEKYLYQRKTQLSPYNPYTLVCFEKCF